MDDEMLTEKTRKAIDTFFNLNGTTYREKKKSLNTFVKTIQSEYCDEEVQDLINNLITTTEYDRSLKTEIIIRFQLESSILETLKSGNEAAIGKVLKNWRFFKNMFNKMTIDDFVDNLLPQLSYKTSIKVIKIIGKNINDNPELADNLFNKLEEKYSIKIAILLLHNCSLYLIKDKCSKYGLDLSSRCLLLIYKKYPAFLKYYFDMMRDEKHKRIYFPRYSQIFKYIAKSNLKLFWELYVNYKFELKIGKHRAMRLLPNEEIMLKYGFENKHLFKCKQILNAARKINLHKELILKSFPNDINDYIRLGINSYSTPNIVYMPKKQIFPLLQELFMQMYNKDFRNYVSLMSGDYLKYVTINEREYILDRMSDKENFLHYYPINRSIPILKEKLKTANDPATRLKLISFLFQTCNVNNNDAKSLLDVLKFVYGRYKNDTTALYKFMENIVRTWKDYKQFTEEHWETVNNLVEYLEYSRMRVNSEHFFQRHFVWLVDNNKSYEKLLDEYMKKCCNRNSLNWGYYFDKSLKHMKIFINEIHNRLPGKSHNLYFQLLRLTVHFDKRFPNEINILNYAYILDYDIKLRNQQSDNEFYFIKNYNKDKSFNKYIKRFDQPHNIRQEIVLYCLENCPEELDNFHSLHKKMQGINKKIRNFLLCPYFVTKHLQLYNKLCVEELEDTNAHIETALLHFFSYDKKFIDVIPNFLPPDDAKIDLKTDTIYVTKQQEIIKYIPQISTPENMKLIRIFCKADYLKFALASLYKIAYKVPLNVLPEFLQNIYEAAVSVKKHALYLGRHLLPVSSYYDFLLAASQLESNLSLRNILSKKTMEYFIENVDEKFFNLFIENLEKIDKKDKDFYDYLINYSKIPQKFIAKYITTIYDNIMSNEDEDIRDKGFSLMEDLPDYIMDELSVNLMKRYLETVDLNTTTFINKCLFHTTGEKHKEMYEFIINLITDLFKKYTLTNKIVRKEITTVITKIIEKAIYYNNIKIIEKLYTIFKSNIQQHTLLKIKLKLEFALMFLESKKDVRKFAESIKPHLLASIELYSFKMITFYRQELLYFITYNQHFDKFLFIRNLFNEGNENEVINLIVIGFLPSTLNRNTFDKYLPILEKLKLSNDPRIMAALDLHFQTVT